MRHYLLLLLLILSAGGVMAADATLDGPSVITAGQTADYDISNLTVEEMIGQCQLKVLPTTAKVKARLSQDLLTKKPYLSVRSEDGKAFTLILDVNIPNRYHWAVKEINLGTDPKPDPQPGPGPGPTPVPTKIKDLVIIEETSKRTVEQAKALTSPSVRSALKAKGVNFLLVDKDAKNSKGTTPEWAAWYIRQAGDELPVMFAVAADGSWSKLKVPTEKDFQAWAEKLP